MTARVHRYASVDGVYHAILTDPAVRDGHVVVVPALREVAVVCGRQPVAVDSSRVFPALPDPSAWRRFARGHYEDDARLARCVVAGLATDPGEAPTATGAGTFRAVYDRADGFGMSRYESEGIAALACELYGADVITALNNFTRATAAWFYGDYGDTVHTFYKARWCCDACRAEAADRLIRSFPSVSRS